METNYYSKYRELNRSAPIPFTYPTYDSILRAESSSEIIKRPAGLLPLPWSHWPFRFTENNFSETHGRICANTQTNKQCQEYSNQQPKPLHCQRRAQNANPMETVNSLFRQTSPKRIFSSLIVTVRSDVLRVSSIERRHVRG